MDTATMMDRSALEQRCLINAKSIFVGNPPTLGRESLLAMALGDRLMYLPAEDVHMTPHLAMRGSWEPWVSVWFCRFLDSRPKGPITILDVGACLGYYSLLACSWATSAGRIVRVHAFEPNRHSMAYLEQNLLVNGFRGFVNTYETALWSEPAVQLDMEYARENYGSLTTNLGDGIPFRVPMSFDSESLDRINPTGGRMIDLLKIDAEGADYKILQGAMDLVKKRIVSTILLEHTCTQGLKWALENGFSVAQVGYDGSTRVADTSMLLESANCEMLLLRTKA